MIVIDRLLLFVAEQRANKTLLFWSQMDASIRGYAVMCFVCDKLIGNVRNYPEASVAEGKHRDAHDQELRGHPWDAIRAALVAGEPEIAKEIYDDATLR